jgi:hypothetical protein
VFEPLQQGVTPQNASYRSRLGLWLGGLLLGVACVQARSTGQATASATIVAEETFEILPEGVLITELTAPDGNIVQIEVATTVKGMVLIRLSNPSPSDAAQAGLEPLGKSLNRGREAGSIGSVGSASIVQNAHNSEGLLSVEMVVTVSTPRAESGTPGDGNSLPLRVTVEFN